MDAHEAFRLADQNTDDAEVEALLAELLRVPSVHTEQLESDPAVKAFVTDVVAPRLEGLTEVSPRVDSMGNLLWRRAGSDASGLAGLLLMGYAMTFPAGSMPDPFSGNIVPGEPYGLKGPCVWGRGVSEQKASLAAMLAAVTAVQRSGCDLANPLCLAVSLAGETGRHDAAAFMFEEGLDARYGIVGLGTQNQVCLGNKGRIDVHITVHGKSCHSSTPWGGVNAIDGARAVLNHLDGLVDGIDHPELGTATLVANRIDSGPAVLHTIQDICRITMDRRLLPGENPKEALAAISARLAELSSWQVEVTQGAFQYPSDVAATSPIARALGHAMAAGGDTRGPIYFPAALDAGYLNHVGIETVMFGPGDLAFAHTDAEVVPLAEVHSAARIYAATALQLLT